MYRLYLLLIAVLAVNHIVKSAPPEHRPPPPGSGNDSGQPPPPGTPGDGTPRPGDNDTDSTRPKPGPPGDGTPRPGDNDTDSTRPKPGPPPPPGPSGDGTPRPGDNDTDSTRPKPGPPPPPGPPGDGTPRPEMPGDNDTDSTRPTPGPPGDGTPRPGDNDTDSTRPKPGPPSPPGPPGDGTPRPGMPDNNDTDSTRPKPGPPLPPGPPSGPGDGTRPKPGRPDHTETSVNQNYSIHMYGGDIALTPEQQATLEATSNQHSPFFIQNAVVTSEQYLWKSGIVYYIFDDSLDAAAIDAIREAMTAFTDSEETCITFRERTNQEDYVRFFSGNGCYSYIGRVTGPQDISIGRGCEYKGIVMHEIFHALGRWHEQSRPDRDLFIKINHNNIASGMESNFEVVSTAFATTQAIEYDFVSLMHYDAYAFSHNDRPTIELVDPDDVSLDDMGQREGFSTGDLQHVRTLYCGDYAGGRWSEWNPWSLCSQKCNGGSRSRTRTCDGGADCEGSNIETEQCNTVQCTVEATWAEWTSWSECTASCGGGRRTRRRSCEGGNTCVGRQIEYTDCNTDLCPGNSTWSEWGSWSDCSRTCQGGTRYRRRQCQNGNDCSGTNVLVEYCNSHLPCDGTVTVSEWTAWSQCTKSCGNGTQFRTRGCAEGSSVCESESQPCNTEDCNPEPALKGIEHIGCYWVPTYDNDLIFLEGTTEDLSDNPTERQNAISKCGTAAQLNNFNVFALAVGFCISGSSNVQEYQYIETDICEGGRGGYYFRWMAMDVYTISDAEKFQDSSTTAGTPSEVGVSSRGGQVMLTAVPSVLLLLVTATLILSV